MKSLSIMMDTNDRRVRTAFDIVDQSRNSVRVIVFRSRDGTGRVVDAECDCFGSEYRLHSNGACPLVKEAI